MYARACELVPPNLWIQENGHLFQDAAQQTQHVQTTPETQSRRNLRAPLSKTCAQHGMQTDAQPICLLYTKHGQCRHGHKCKYKHVHKEPSANFSECSRSFSTAKPTLLSQPPTPVSTTKPAMLISTLPTGSISPIHNNVSEIYVPTPVKSTFSQEQVEKVRKHDAQLADVLRKVTAEHQSNVGKDTMALTRK